MLHLLLAKLFPWATGVNWRKIVILSGISAFVLLIIYCYLQHVALKQNQLIYKNPMVIKSMRTIKIEGPVRIVTKIVETPGRVEREIVEERGPVTTTNETMTVQTPVFPQPSKSNNRWLAGVSIDPLNIRDSQRFGGYIGYGFFNRFDLLCGYSESNKPVAMIVFRF